MQLIFDPYLSILERPKIGQYASRSREHTSLYGFILRIYVNGHSEDAFSTEELSATSQDNPASLRFIQSFVFPTWM